VDAAPSVLFDAVVIAGGQADASLAADGRMVEFVKDQYRHCKAILALKEDSAVLAKAGIRPASDDPGLIVGAEDDGDIDTALTAFERALGRHRAFERESDPPRV
jgi:catalase